MSRATTTPNTLARRTYGQCPFCCHFGTDCKCHTRKTMPVERAWQELFLVVENEPETRTGYPSVVLAAYRSQAGAEARVAYERKRRGLTDDEAYEDADISFDIETVRVFP